ncbi:MAG: hypothetical protein LC808_06955 [Actinobacteria bacterium]|nr:hypothetical protein [Actinomycetota bacterium]
MEAVTGGRVASPGLHHLTLGVFTTIDTWASDPAIDAVTQILEAAGEQAELIPHSIGTVLPLLVGEPERLLVALDAIQRLDLHEAATGLDSLVWRGIPDAVLAAASLAPHPGVSPEFRELVQAHGSDMVEPWQRDLFLTRLDPEHQPERDSVRADREVRWFDTPPSDARHPIVGLAPVSEGFPARDQLWLAADLVARGIVVRRLPVQALSDAPPGWLPSWAPTVGPRPSDRVRTPARIDSLARHRILDTVLANVPARIRSRSALERRHARVLPDITDIEVFDDGAIPRPETAFLSGMRRRGLDLWKKEEALRPLEFHGLYYWRFSQVVAFRVASYLYARAGRRRGLASTAAQLVDVVRREREVPVGITSDGRVMVSRGGDLEDIETGVRASEHVISMTDDVYQPFTIEGLEVPKLTHPSEHISVHPAVVAGLPCVAGTRISANIVRAALDIARRGGVLEPIEYVQDLYPELRSEQIIDAERMVSKVRATR